MPRKGARSTGSIYSTHTKHRAHDSSQGVLSIWVAATLHSFIRSSCIQSSASRYSKFSSLKALSDQARPSPPILRGAYYLNDRDSRPRYGKQTWVAATLLPSVPTSVASLTCVAARHGVRGQYSKPHTKHRAHDPSKPKKGARGM